MSKSTTPNKPSAIVQSSTASPDAPPANNTPAETPMSPFWLLETGSAKKLGQHSTGYLHYQVLADHDRCNLFIALTKNDGGGHCSKERVNFIAVEACLKPYTTGEPFPAKALKMAYKSRSSNNPSFMAALLRAQGLTAAAPEAESKHIIAGDWAAWRQKMLTAPGTIIELVADIDDEKQGEGDLAPLHKEHKKNPENPDKKIEP